MTDTNTPYPPERQNAHNVWERTERFFERIDRDRASRANSPAPVSPQGVSSIEA